MISVRDRRGRRHVSVEGSRYGVLAVVAVVVSGLTACTVREDSAATIQGATMGTTYQVRYAPPKPPGDLARAIDTLLDEINLSLSTFAPTSLVSRINGATDASWQAVDRHFAMVFSRSGDIHEDTAGAFNPAVGPLVDAWGFGPGGTDGVPDDQRVRQLLALADLGAFVLETDPPAVRKLVPGARLDFSAIAKGYAVDEVGRLLEAQGIADYMVEIGGEVRTRGHHPSGRGWRVGIERPLAAATDRQAVEQVLSLNDTALATSGNYRNYFEEDGRRYAHILDPHTGYPATSDLLSVTVLAADSMTADAYATAFMVMGLDASMSLVESREGLDAYFILSDDPDGFREKWSEGFGALLAD